MTPLLYYWEKNVILNVLHKSGGQKFNTFLGWTVPLNVLHGENYVDAHFFLMNIWLFQLDTLD